MSLASTLTLRINAPPSFLNTKKDRNLEEEKLHALEEEERWYIIADAAGRLVLVAGGMLSGTGVRDVCGLKFFAEMLMNYGSIQTWLKHGSSIVLRQVKR